MHIYIPVKICVLPKKDQVCQDCTRLLAQKDLQNVKKIYQLYTYTSTLDVSLTPQPRHAKNVVPRGSQTDSHPGQYRTIRKKGRTATNSSLGR